MSTDSALQTNFADKIYRIFKLNRRTCLLYNDLSLSFKKEYDDELDMAELRNLPFIYFSKNNNGNNIIYLIIELDDCCNHCKYTHCKLLHSMHPNDKFKLIYPSNNNHNNHNNHNHKLCKIQLPNIRLIQRIKDILNESPSNNNKKPKQMTLNAMITRHNDKYPHFRSHEPTSHGIGIRFKSTFNISFDDNINDYIISFKYDPVIPTHSNYKKHQLWRPKTSPISTTRNNKNNDIDININMIPEQMNKYYLSITISSEWNDSKLISDLVRHISKSTGKHIIDCYIANRTRFGFFTAKNEEIADIFIKNASNGKIKCWGRTINALNIAIPKNNGNNNNIQRQQKGFRVKIENLNCIMGGRDFENWCYQMTNTRNEKHLIYDIEIIFHFIEKGTTECIMVFETDHDIKYIMNELQNVPFRGYPLRFKPWKHPKCELIKKNEKKKKSEIIIPDQLDKYYLSISISSQWIDNKLIMDIMRHISVNTGKHIVDIYIPNRYRFGFFTVKKKKIADILINNARNKKIKCFGRIINAFHSVIPKNRKHHHIQNGYRIRIENVNNIINHRDFENWIYKITNIEKKNKKNLIYDIVLIAPEIQIGSTQCIIVFDTIDDTKFIIKKLKNIKFRGTTLRFKHWNHPNNNHHVIHQNNNQFKLKIIKPKKRDIVQVNNDENVSMNKVNNINENGSNKPKSPIIKEVKVLNKNVMDNDDDGVIKTNKLRSKPPGFDGNNQITNNNKKEKTENTRKLNVESVKNTNTRNNRINNDESELQKLCDIENKMENVRYERDNVLTPSLIKLSESMVKYQTNPRLLEISQNKLTYYQIQQQQNDVLLKINENQTLYQELDEKRKYIQNKYEENKKAILIKKLMNILERMNFDTFDIVLSEIMDIMNEGIMEDIIDLILEFAVKRREFLNEYINLLQNILNLEQNNDLLIGEMVLNKTRLMFLKYLKIQNIDKESFFGIMEVMAELYNIGLFKINLIFGGVLNGLLPCSSSNGQISDIEMEGIYLLFVKCGELLNKENSENVDKYIYKLNKIGMNKTIIDKILRLRDNKWMNNKFGDNYNSLLLQHKELQIRYNKLEQRYNAIKIKKCDYRRWDTKDIVNWIINLNGSRYGKYYDILINNMMNEGIDGKCMMNLDKNDLHRLGIKQFKDKSDIFIMIKELIKENNKININHNKQCIICIDKIKNYALIPCGHLCLCQKCKDKINEKCPICKKKYKQIIKIYD